jgi:voltage-gated sodium channel
MACGDFPGASCSNGWRVSDRRSIVDIKKISAGPKPNSLTRFTEGAPFTGFIILTIIVASVVVGMETSDALMEKYGRILHGLDAIVLAIFAVEAILKIAAGGKKFWKYFQDPWNCFDFLIVVVVLLPVGASYVAVLRMARILRVIRLASMIPRLQVLVNALLDSIPSMFYAGLLLAMLFYIYAVLGTMLWRQNDPVHFQNIWIAMLSLFRVATLEDWTDIMYINMYGSESYGYTPQMLLETGAISSASPLGAAGFFVSFVMIGTMVILNLFIGIVMESMSKAQRQSEADRTARQAKQSTRKALEARLTGIQERLDLFREDIEVVSALVERGYVEQAEAVLNKIEEGKK